MNIIIIFFIIGIVIIFISQVLSFFVKFDKFYEKKGEKKLIEFKNQCLIISILSFIFSFIIPFKIYLALIFIKDKEILDLFVGIIVFVAILSVSSGFMFIQYYFKIKSYFFVRSITRIFCNIFKERRVEAKKNRHYSHLDCINTGAILYCLRN